MNEPAPQAGAKPPAGPEAGAAVVDSHHHVWDLAVRDRAWLREKQNWADEESMARLRRSFTMADLEPQADAAGVGATVVVQTETDPAETPELLALAAGHRLVAGVVGWVDLTGPGVADAIAGLRERPGGRYLAGIRHPVLTEADEEWLGRPGVLRGLAGVAAAGLVYDVVCRQGQLPGALAAARALPGLTFVLDHVGNPEDDPPGDGVWAGTLRALAALPNTVCKLSGILSGALTGPGEIDPLVRRYYEIALGAFGPGRLMFGSDWPVCTLASPYPAVVDAARVLIGGLSAAERAAVMGGTARHTYRLATDGS
jgi:L-fuconolactonase